MIFEKLENARKEALEQFEKVKSLDELNQLRINYLSKKGIVSEAMQEMRNVSASERPKIGMVANKVKEEIENAYNKNKERLENEVLNEKLKNETIDVTLPGYKFHQGSKHLLISTINEIEDLFIGMGYEIVEGPEIEEDKYNFELLNLPKGHPARDMQDTFYINQTSLLRTHTSPVQARTMIKSNGKPIKVICPGKVYRRDDDDATHSHQFMQIEGLVIDENITLADLKGTLLEVAKKMFGEERKIRLRPSYFPFTEPSVEVDVSCHKCGGKGCSICKKTGWIEVLGAGMVNKNVLQMCGYDDQKMQGFAFGIGAERFAMLKYGIDDIRNFYINDLRFLEQFKEVK